MEGGFHNMKPLSTIEAKNILNDISKKENMNVDKQIDDIDYFGCVTQSVLLFINKYRPLEQLATYNHIYNNRRKNPLYRNLVNEHLPIEERAVALSSYVTQVLIHSKNLIRDNKEEDSEYYLKEISHLDVVTNALMRYAKYNDVDELNRVFMMIRDVFKNLYFDM